MLRTCTCLIVLFSFYTFYNWSKASPIKLVIRQVNNTNNGGFSEPDKAGTSIGVSALLLTIISSSVGVIVAIIGWYFSRKVLVATIEENNDGSLSCEVKIGEKRVVNDVTYKWYKLNLQDTQQPPRDSISTSNNLPQQKSVFDSQQRYQCEVEYTARSKNFCCRIRRATSNTLVVRKKYIIATVQECDDGKLKCNVEKDNERIDNGLTYQWYDGVRKLEGETGAQLAQNPVTFESVQNYRCEVKYNAMNWNESVPVRCKPLKKHLVARIENCDGDSLICEVTLDNESVFEHLTYKWYENDEIIDNETDKQLQQQQSVFLSKQKYKCVVVYKKGNISIEATSNTLTVKKKNLVARIENSDDDSLICEVMLDNESINEHLTYKWYENETEIPQETHKQLQQRQSVFMLKQKYKCVVVYKRENISIEATSNTLTVKKKNIIATIEECSDGKLKCNVEKDNERIEDGLTYQWYDGDNELQGETGKCLAQNPVSFESVQKYKCEIKYTASNWDPDVVVKETSNTLKKHLIAMIKESIDGKVECEAKQDDESIRRDDLTYEWYENGKVISGETGQVLPQQRAIFEHNQKYSCAVVYTKGNRQINATSDSLLIRKKFNHVAELQRLYGKLKPCDMRDFGLEGIVLTFMETKYIEVRGDEQADQEKRTNQESITFKKLKESIFEDAKIWIISGVPGSGKTTSINRLCREWKENDQPHKILILVRLAELNDIEKDHCTLRTIIKKAIPCLESDDSYHDEALQRIECEINEDPGKYIFALDGYDEYQKSEEDNFIKKLIKRLVLDKCTVVITTRPYSCENLKREIKSHSADFTEFKIAPFENIDDFIQQHYVDKAIEDAKEKAKNLTNTVKKHDFLHSLCTLPLHCAMVCSYFDADPSTPPETITELYKFFIEMTTRRHYEKYKNGEGSKNEMLKQVCKLAYEKIAGKGQSVEIDDQSGLGLVVVRSHKKERQASPVKVYEFIHETIKEYLAALHLKGMLNDMPEGDLDLIIEDEKKSEVLKFLCGLTKDVGVFKKIVNTKPGDIMYCIQCAYEVQKKDVCDHVMSQLVTEGNFEVHEIILSPSDCAAIFKVLEPSQLRCLDLEDCRIGPEGARLLKGGLEKCSKLEKLSLRWNDIGDKGAEHISDAIMQLSTLTHLNLVGNNIGDKGAKHLSEVIEKSPSLAWLNLSENKIGDKGAKHISVAIKESSSLKYLVLLWNNIGEKGKELLMTAKDSINRKPINPQEQPQLRIIF